MTDTIVLALVQPGTFVDSLTEVLRNGARALLAQAIKTEVAGFLAAYADKRTDDGRQPVRHGTCLEQSSTMESRSSVQMLKPLPPDPIVTKIRR